MPKPPLKKTRKLAEAQAYGEEIGKFKAWKHIKPIDRLKYFFWKKLEKVDPIEVIEILAVAWVIKATVELGEEVAFRSSVMKLAVWLSGISYEDVQALDQLVHDITDSIPAEILQWLLSFGLAAVIVRWLHSESGKDAIGSIKGLASGLLFAG